MDGVFVKKEVILNKLNCAHCAGKIEEEVNNLEELENLSFNFTTKKLRFDMQEDANTDEVFEKI